MRPQPLDYRTIEPIRATAPTTFERVALFCLFAISAASAALFLIHADAYGMLASRIIGAAVFSIAAALFFGLAIRKVPADARE